MKNLEKQLDWDYTKLAKSYVFRPDYAVDVINEIALKTALSSSSLICEIGAGDGHLTKMLSGYDAQIHAIEPNTEMRYEGERNTENLKDHVFWSDGTGEETGKPCDTYDLVIFGSSFNVTDRSKSLAESANILKKGGWFSCLWNHRDLDDPLQAEIEDLIQEFIPNYGYGTRREDQTDVIAKSKLFNAAEKIEARTVHNVHRDLWLEAWNSHATLARQAGDSFKTITNEIKNHVLGKYGETLSVPYITRAWVASVKK